MVDFGDGPKPLNAKCKPSPPNPKLSILAPYILSPKPCARKVFNPAAKFVNDEGGERLRFDVFSDDEQPCRV